MGNLRNKAKVFIHTRLLRMNTITWKSKEEQLCVMLFKLYLAKGVGVFLFYFSHPNLFLGQFSIISKVFDLKIGESSYSA